MTFQSDLDAMLRSDGQQVTLRRVVGTTNQTNVDCQCWAKVSDYEPRELAGSINQGDRKAIISITDIDAAQWPGGQRVTSPPSAVDPRIPRKGDKMVIDGRVHNVEAADTVKYANRLHRFNLQVRG